jgi:hypothetical protein
MEELPKTPLCSHHTVFIKPVRVAIARKTSQQIASPETILCSQEKLRLAAKNTRRKSFIGGF